MELGSTTLLRRLMRSWYYFALNNCRLRRKVACKVRDEHSAVRGMPQPSETVAKMATKSLSLGRQGIRCVDNLLPMSDAMTLPFPLFLSPCTIQVEATPGDHAFPTVHGKTTIVMEHLS